MTPPLLATDKPSRSTTTAYRELLTKLWILDPVTARMPAPGPLSRLVKGDKRQLCAPGLAVHLMEVTEDRHVRHLH